MNGSLRVTPLRLTLLAALAFTTVTPCLAQSANGSGSAAGPVITGFRTAKFGMTETQIRHEIANDFKTPANAIGEAVNPLQRTTVLSVLVPDLVPGGGAAVVNYVLGYQSHKLIQISIVWSPAFDPKITPAILAQDGESLQQYFATEGFPPDRITGDIPTQNGELMLRARDDIGNVVSLIISGTIAKDKASSKALLTPTDLTLTYATDPLNPDVFQLTKGTF
jgi:hypothetical protein